MSEYTLSVVQICPDAYKTVAESIAEAAGYGPNNLSVKLVDGDGNIYWGCHAWWIPEALQQNMELPEGTPEEYRIALSHVITSVREHGDAHEHWMFVLLENGLAVETVETT